MLSRPPIGFVVEGHGEYNCYPSLLCRILECGGMKIPRVNAGGCGGVIRRLPEHLSDLLLVDNPVNVIVTVDLIDVIKQGFAKDCAELMENLRSSVDKWRAAVEADGRLHPLPRRVTCLAQVKKFESWLIADIDGLKAANLIDPEIEQAEDAEAVDDPASYLGNILKADTNIKNPQFAKTLVSAIDPKKMRLRSASFDAFYVESQSMYQEWIAPFAT